MEPNGQSNESKLRANARWKLLRQAILGNPTSHLETKIPHNDSKKLYAVSIHRFPGFQMLKKNFVSYSIDNVESDEQNIKIKDFGAKLSRIHFSKELMKKIDLNLNYKAKMDGNIFLERTRETLIIRSATLLHYQYDRQNKESTSIKMKHVEITLSAQVEDTKELKWLVNHLMNRNVCTATISEFRCIESNRMDIDVQIPISSIIGKQSLVFEYRCVQYTIPKQEKLLQTGKQSIFPTKPIYFRVREHTNYFKSSSPKNTKIDLKALTSQRHFGVDNTGNTRIWDSEDTLTYCLFSPEIISPMLNIQYLLNLAKPIPENTNLNWKNCSPYHKELNVVELGAGMAGLAGLSLATMNLSGQLQNTKINVVITDGHPDAVFSNKVNATLTHFLYQKGTQKRCINNIFSKRLLWSTGQDGIDGCSALRRNCIEDGTYFEVCLVSDCLHFQEFHAALIACIGRLLGIGGICILCQPPRGKSQENFISIIESMKKCSTNTNNLGNLFESQLVENYHPVLTKLHEKYKIVSPNEYDPNIHYPHMLILKKIRDYREDHDTAAAIEAMGKRNAC